MPSKQQHEASRCQNDCSGKTRQSDRQRESKISSVTEGKQDDDKVLSDMFKPVLSPLNKIVERIAPSEREGPNREPQVDLARMRQSLSKSEQDIHYGIRQTSKKLMIGNAKVNSDPQNNYIGEKTYPATHGLVELLCVRRILTSPLSQKLTRPLTRLSSWISTHITITIVRSAKCVSTVPCELRAPEDFLN